MVILVSPISLFAYSFFINQGTEKIERLVTELGFCRREVNVSSAAFTQMSKQRRLNIQNTNVCKAPNLLPGSRKLKYINLSQSQKLVRTSDFFRLEKLSDNVGSL